MKAAAVRRVSTWAAGKDVYGLLGSLKDLGLSGVKGGDALQPGASSTALKKAFHRASLSLHPDRLQGADMTPQKKAEAEEVFKALSSAYDAATTLEA